MALELGRRHIAVVLQNVVERTLAGGCCNKAVVVAPTHGPHGPLLLQAVGHQLHDIVKLLLAKLVEGGTPEDEAAASRLWKKTHKFAPLSGRGGRRQGG